MLIRKLRRAWLFFITLVFVMPGLELCAAPSLPQLLPEREYNEAPQDERHIEFNETTHVGSRAVRELHREKILGFFAMMCLTVAALQFMTVKSAEATPASKETAEPKTRIGLGDRAEEIAVAKHSMMFKGRELKYTSTSGYLDVVKEDGTRKAAIFFIAYTLDVEVSKSERPVTFAFNGGPGSSSVWLHLGAFGPRRVDLQDKLHASAPPYKLIANEDTWLDKTDLVFIDPVGTGYSRSAPDEKDDQFHGVEEDIESVGDFIRLWTTQNQRWTSPKFLAGESYGTTRAAGLAGYLQDRHGMYLNGLMMISSVLQFNTLRFGPDNIWPYILFLPSLTATSFYHNRLPAKYQSDLRATLDEVENFALNEYLLALVKGSAMEEDERQQIADRLVEFTGLDKEWVLLSELKIHSQRYCKELLRTEGDTLGRLDSRFKGIDANAHGERVEHDPGMAALNGPYTALLNDYVRGELKYENDIPYEVHSSIARSWNWGSASAGHTNLAETLREAMAKNPDLKVWISSGYYDLATPYFGMEFTIRQMGLDPARRENITMTYYAAGHMMYIHTASLKRFKKDFDDFIDSVIPKIG